MDSLESLFKRCYEADYTHVNEDGDFAIQREGDKVYLQTKDNNVNTPFQEVKTLYLYKKK